MSLTVTRPDVTLRALKGGLRDVAGNLTYAIGSGHNDEIISFGRWQWGEGGFKPVPTLPPMPKDATPRQVKDHRVADGLLSRYVENNALRDTLVSLRELIADTVDGAGELQSSYIGDELLRQRKRYGERQLARVGTTITTAQSAAERCAEVRADMARESLRISTANQILQAMGQESLGNLEDDDEPNAGTIRALQQSVFDAEIVRNLRPLDPVQHELVAGRRELIKPYDDPRVFAAVFRVPRMLVPLTDDELQGLAYMGFERNWPKSSMVTDTIEQMVEQIQPVAGEAVRLMGQLIDPGYPFEVFRKVKGGRWALEGIAGKYAAEEGCTRVLNDLRAYAGEAA